MASEQCSPYDQYGQRVYVENGNGTVSRYAYDPTRRWLDSLNTVGPNSAVLQNARYHFDAVGNVESIDDDNGRVQVTKSYQYDSLYQLIGANQQYTEKSIGGINSSLTQGFQYDLIGNMEKKTSVCSSSPEIERAIRLTYDFGYLYDTAKIHTTTEIGDTLYEHDANGNTIKKTPKTTASGTSSPTPNARPEELDASTGFSGTGFALDRTPKVKNDGATYEWDFENRMVKADSAGKVTLFSYDSGGERRSKASESGETQYVDKYWQETIKATGQAPVVEKHIFVGTTRVCTSLGYWEYTPSPQETFWYHADHIGSTAVVTDAQGEEYERLEYSPYGETWVEDTRDVLDSLSYMFSGKEMDSETGLYYYGARYLDPRTSMWMSADPAMAEYLPQAPVSDEAKQANGNLPGMGGVFSPVNLATYHYAGNNPVRYTDPDGNAPVAASEIQKKAMAACTIWPVRGTGISDVSSPKNIRSDPFGSGKLSMHSGMDIKAAKGTDVLASGDGTVLEVGNDDTFGNYLVIDHGDGITTKYGHLDSVPAVAKDAKVKAGDIIGEVGSTGSSTGPHLHFELRINGVKKNPANYLPSAQNPFGRTSASIPGSSNKPTSTPSSTVTPKVTAPASTEDYSSLLD
jgi:RHS repeat-associated protein